MSVKIQEETLPAGGLSTGDRTRYLQRMGMLDAEFSTWLAHYIEISDWEFPRRFRYLTTDRNKGTKRNDRIVNNTPPISVRVLAAGKMAGMTSPARPWARFTVSDPMMADDDDVKGWLQICERAFYETMAKSNLYNCLHECYGIQGSFATAAMYIQEDEEDDVRGVVFPVGQYRIATNARQRVDTIYRKFSMTIGQMVEEFELSSCSTEVQDLYKKHQYDQWRIVIHCIEPNRGRDARYADLRNMPFRSVWFEAEAGETHQQFLRISGYEEFPVIVWRWFVTGEDAYGSGSPGMDSLGDCKALQLAERKKAKAFDKIVDPPMNAPASMRAQRLSLLPGDNNFVPDGQQSTFKPAIEIKPEAISVATAEIQTIERRIKVGFYVDLFQMMLEDEAQQPRTATDIVKRNEEKMLQLGPVVERDEDEGLDPMINRVMNILFRRGRVPPPPPQLRGQRVKVEYISVMAQAQKLVGSAAIERFVSFLGSTSAVKKKILDNLNEDELAREYARVLGVPPSILNKEKVVAQIRAEAARQEQAAQAMQAMGGMAQAAKAASGAEITDNNVLGRLMGGVQ